MVLTETDATFLRNHNFDAEDAGVSSLTNYIQAQVKARRLLIDGYIEGRPGKSFSLNDIVRETGLDVTLCKSVVDTHPHVEKIRGWHKYDQYRSTAPQLVETPIAPVQQDVGNKAALGRQAREDYYYLINLRRQQLKRKTIRRY